MKDLFLTFFKLGAFTFGGGYAMVMMMKEECVEKKRWITNEEFLNVMTIAESTPGPLSINLATFIGYKIGKFKGAVISTIGVLLPSIIVIYIISLFFEDFLRIEIVKNAFIGIRIAIGIIIMRAGINLIKEEYKINRDKLLTIILFSIYFFVVFVTEFIKRPISNIYYILVAFLISLILIVVKKNDIH